MSLTFPRKQILTDKIIFSKIKVSIKIRLFYFNSSNNNIPGSHLAYLAYHTLKTQNCKLFLKWV